MSIGTQDREQAVSVAIREISHIATLPEVTLKIVELVEDPSSTAQDLHNVIANDPALSSRILKVVNSSFYGLPGQIGSINRAIVMLGLNAVKNIAIAASLAKLFRGGDLSHGFSARAIWEHAVACGAITKVVADTAKVGFSDEAFLAGLMHNIGLMVEMQFDRNKLIEVVQNLGVNAEGVPANDMRAVEAQIFGADHQDFGKGLCEKWKFPNNFTLVTGYHHNPMEAPADARRLPAMVYIADRLVGSVEGQFRLDLTSLDIDPAVLEVLGLTETGLQAIRERVDEEIANTAGLLG
ncbi:MAG: HDOD domain-containing protein [Phycisphaerales bacterium]|jgi:HD-like signal output (HDOD) protein